MNQESKIFIIIAALTLAIFLGAVWLLSGGGEKVVNNQSLLGVSTQATGSATPKATLVEFSDYQCPYCAKVWPYVEDLTDKYPDKLQFIYRHFPLPQHQYAKGAAYAAEAAGKQGKFWQMSALIFENQSSLSHELLVELAKKLELDMEKFQQDRNSSAVKDRVDADWTDGQKLGVNSTPTFFLNGKKMKLNSFSDLEQEVLKVLE